jgi:hypothetical protein
VQFWSAFHGKVPVKEECWIKYLNRFAIETQLQEVPKLTLIMTRKLFMIILIFQLSRDGDITKFRRMNRDWATKHCKLVGQGKDTAKQ